MNTSAQDVACGAAPSTPRVVSFGEFFRYHGWLAPGVRWFRQIGFKGKASWVSLAFLTPLLMALGFLVSSAKDQVDVAVAERQGIEYVSPLMDLLQAAQDRRDAALGDKADLTQSQQAVQAAFARVQAQHQRLGAGWDLQAAFTPLQTLHDALLQTPAAANSDARYAEHSAYIDAALDLLAKVADGSQLSLDPELHTYHMMNMAVLLGPAQAENTARLASMGSLILRDAAKGKEVGAARHEVLTTGLALWTYIDKGVTNSLKLGLGEDASKDKRLDMEGAHKASEALRAALRKQVLVASVEGDPAAFAALGQDALQRQTALNRAVLARLDEQLGARIARLQSRTAQQLAFAGAFVALAIYLLMAFYRVMMGGLHEVTSHLREITQGNLTTAPRPWGKDEAAHLMSALGEMQLSLRRVVSTVLQSAGHVQNASGEISAASVDLSARTEKSAASLQETAASMEQIASTVRHTADAVHSASAIVRDNAAAATRGGEVIAQVVHTMQDIRASSGQIGEIINVIDSIAFQTNILALNAAVEAARAGEQGRGFAVVATEVRALAGRSAAAAREIKTLISASIEQVEAGNRVVADAGTTIKAIVANAERIAGMMGEIANATKEQSAGVSQVGQAVTHMDQSTQQNAALVEQTTAAAVSLSDQARRLADEMNFFRLAARGS